MYRCRQILTDRGPSIAVSDDPRLVATAQDDYYEQRLAEAAHKSQNKKQLIRQLRTELEIFRSAGQQFQVVISERE